MIHHDGPIQTNPIFSLLSSITGWLFMAYLFIQALFHPFDYVDFIFGTSILIYFIEFLNIHASMMLQGNIHTKEKQPSRFVLALFYMFFVVIFLFAFGNVIMIAFFAISLITKVLSYRSFEDRHQQASRVLVLMATTMPLVFLAPIIAMVFPFSAEFMMLKPSNTSGLFADLPQTILVWGFVYSIANAGLEIYFFQKKHS